MLLSAPTPAQKGLTAARPTPKKTNNRPAIAAAPFAAAHDAHFRPLNRSSRPVKPFQPTFRPSRPYRFPAKPFFPPPQPHAFGPRKPIRFRPIKPAPKWVAPPTTKSAPQSSASSVSPNLSSNGRSASEPRKSPLTFIPDYSAVTADENGNEGHICQLHSQTLDECLDQEGTYVCKALGPRSYIIQKVYTYQRFGMIVAF